MKTSIVIAAAIALSGTPAYAASLLVNGNFEASTSQTTTPTGWTNIGHTDGVISYSNFGTPAFDGQYYYDIGGYGGATPAIGDGITQSVLTTIGQSYALTFGYSGENTFGVTTVLDVIIGSQLSQFTIVGDNTGVFKKPFTTTSINYTAVNSVTPISFKIASSTQIGFNDPLIDGVVFDTTGVSAVPEPATWAMMLLGFGAIGGALRSAKRRSDQKFDAKIKRITGGAPA
jgi:hypothetical protein